MFLAICEGAIESEAKTRYMNRRLLAYQRSGQAEQLPVDPSVMQNTQSQMTANLIQQSNKTGMGSPSLQDV